MRTEFTKHLPSFVRTNPYSAGLLAVTFAVITLLGALILVAYYDLHQPGEFPKEIFMNATMGILFLFALNCLHLALLLYQKRWIESAVTGTLLGVGYNLALLADSMIT
jgi:hypothetical protein